MSRKVKVIQVEGRGEVTLKEVSAYGVWQAWQSDDRIAQLAALMDDAMSPGFDEVKTWYPSEIEQVVAGALEVNGSFFAVARALKVDGLITGIVSQMESSLPELFASSFKQAMSTPGITDGLL